MAEGMTKHERLLTLHHPASALHAPLDIGYQKTTVLSQSVTDLIKHGVYKSEEDFIEDCYG